MKEPFAHNPSYCFASNGEKNAADQTLQGFNASHSQQYMPTLSECGRLTQPLVEKMSRCTTYDVLSLSSQVMVLDVSSPLSVAFIAAQETKLGSGVLWDPIRKEFVGILTSTDHVKILLYCNLHPEETEEVACWTIGYWVSIRDSPNLLKRAASEANPCAISGSSPAPPSGPHSSFVSCSTRTTLKEVLERMRQHNVHRLAVLAEKESSSFSVVAMMDVQQIVEYLGARLFDKDAAGLFRVASAGDGSGTLGGDDVQGDGDESASTFFHLNRSALPRLVSSIVSAGSDTEAMRDIRVGPYSSIFDIPFRCLPMIGVHRHRSIYVTMDNTIAEALQLMLDQNIESIAVCTAERIITDVISRSDLLRMENQGVYDTNITVREVIGGKTLKMVYVFHESDILWDIFSQFVQRRVRELFMVDPTTNQLVGQLNIVEFVYFLVFASAE